jgi:hydroxymethylpyrimidine/phosphomethylpyrimidine kinase
VVQAVVDGVLAHALQDVLVVDPVMVATSGDLLVTDAAVALVRNQLLPLARVVTPNLDEARVLLNRPIRDRDGMRRAAESLVRELGARAALVKGGHLDGDVVTDILYDGRDWTIIEHPRLDSTNTHGTGCTLSAAIAAKLALGASLESAVRAATEYVHQAIATAPGLGGGHGPLNHFA